MRFKKNHRGPAAALQTSATIFSILSALLITSCRGVPSDPSIALISDNSQQLVLECSFSGPVVPEVSWLDSEENLLSAGPANRVRVSDDLYTVSSRLTVEKSHSSRYTCRVQQGDQHRQTHFYVKAYPAQESCCLCKLMGFLIITVVVVGMCFKYCPCGRAKPHREW